MHVLNFIHVCFPNRFTSKRVNQGVQLDGKKKGNKIKAT
jgi:hypothetical protein